MNEYPKDIIENLLLLPFEGFLQNILFPFGGFLQNVVLDIKLFPERVCAFKFWQNLPNFLKNYVFCTVTMPFASWQGMIFHPRGILSSDQALFWANQFKTVKRSLKPRYGGIRHKGQVRL